MHMTPANPIPRRRQAKKPQGFTRWAKMALAGQGLTVTSLAKQLGKSRGAVSLAINHPTVMPGLVEQIKHTLQGQEVQA